MRVAEAPVILFDGTCNLCDHAIHFVIDREREHELKFAAIQSDGGRALLEANATAEQARTIREGVKGDGDPDSVVLIEGQRLHTHSTAALRIARYLRWPWSWLWVLVIVPRESRPS